jgi:hypothetical protein
MLIISNKGYVTSLTDSQENSSLLDRNFQFKDFRYGDEIYVACCGRGLWIGRISTSYGGAVGEALRFNPEGRGFDSRWSHWDFSLI